MQGPHEAQACVPAQPPCPRSAPRPLGHCGQEPSLRTGRRGLRDASLSHGRKVGTARGPPTVTHSALRVASTGRGSLEATSGGQSRALCSLSTSPSVSEDRGSSLCIQIKRRGKGRPAKASSRCPLRLMGQDAPHPLRTGGLGKLVFRFSRLRAADLHPENRAWGVEWVTGSWRPLRLSLAASQARSPGQTPLLHPGVLPL